MTLISLGRVTVPTPGTPVALTTDTKLRAARLTLQTPTANTGKMYFGKTGMTKATLAGVARVLATYDSYEITTADGMDGISLAQLALDADVANEGLLVSYWVE